MDLKFKLGDRVKMLVDKDDNGHELFPTGTKGIITDIFNNGKYPYEVKTEDGNFWYYNDSMLERTKCPECNKENNMDKVTYKLTIEDAETLIAFIKMHERKEISEETWDVCMKLQDFVDDEL